MRLVHLKDSKGLDHHVNPDHVIKVLECDAHGKIRVRLSAGEDIVLDPGMTTDTALEVTDRLQGNEGAA